MGYYSVVTGSIIFSPPIRWAEVKDNAFTINEPGVNYVDKDVMLESFGVHSEDDDLIDTIRPSSEDSYKVYNIVTDLQELVDLLGKDRTYYGFLSIEGEGYGDGPDLWRLKVKGGKVVEVRPKIVWLED